MMGSLPPALPPALPVGEAVRWVGSRPSLLWPVGPPLVGAVTLASLDRVPADAWPTTPVSAVAIPADQITVQADQPLDAVLERLAASQAPGLLVVDGTTPVGLLTLSLIGDAVG
jgi:CBS domain-containing protein